MTTGDVTEVREIILTRIADILERQYAEPLDDLSTESVFARLAFKADPHLNELRLALERMERNEFGACIFCKQEIPLRVLRSFPTAHFCDNCSVSLESRSHPQAVSHVKAS